MYRETSISTPNDLSQLTTQTVTDQRQATFNEDGSKILPQVKFAKPDHPRLDQSIEDSRAKNTQLSTDIFDTWRRAHCITSPRDEARLYTPSQFDFLNDISSYNQRLFCTLLQSQPNEPDFSRISKHDTGLDQSYYIFTTPECDGTFNRRVIKSLSSPNANEYTRVFNQLKGFSPSLWRAFLEYSNDPHSENNAVRLGCGGYSKIKLGCEVSRLDGFLEYLALRQQTPKIHDHLQLARVMRPEVPYQGRAGGESLVTTSDYFPLFQSAQRNRCVASIDAALARSKLQDTTAIRAQTIDTLNAYPSYYSVSTLGYSSLADVMTQTNIKNSVLAADADPKDLKQFITQLLSLMGSDSPSTLTGRSTIEQSRFAAAKFVHYMRTTGVDRANSALLSLARQITDAVLKLHEQNKCHGDIKPANCMLVPNEHTFPSDELIIKLADIDSLSDINSQARVVSPLFSAPSLPRPSNKNKPIPRNKAVENDRHALGKTIEYLAQAIDKLNEFSGSFVADKATNKDQATLNTFNTLNTWKNASAGLKSIADGLCNGCKTIQTKNYVVSLAQIIVLKLQLIDARESNPKPQKATITEKQIEHNLLETIQTIAVNLRLASSKAALVDIHKITTSPGHLCKSQALEILDLLGASRSMGQDYLETVITLSRNLAQRSIETDSPLDFDMLLHLGVLGSKELVGPIQHAKHRLDTIEFSILSGMNAGSWDTGVKRPTIKDINLLGLLSLSLQAPPQQLDKTTNNQTLAEQFAKLSNTQTNRHAFQATFATTIETTPLAQGRAIARERGGVGIDMRESNVLNPEEQQIFKQLYGVKPSNVWHSLRDGADQSAYKSALAKYYTNHAMGKVKNTGHSVSQAWQTLKSPFMTSPKL